MKPWSWIFISILFFIVSCSSEQDQPNSEMVYFCDAESQLTAEDGSFIFENQGNQFKSAETQTNEFAFEGSYSIKLDQDHPYGFSFILTDIKKDEFFKASVWEKDTLSTGALIAVASGSTNFTLSSIESGHYQFERGWKKHDLQFKAITDLDSLTFFVFTGGSGQVTYFDNLKVERFKHRPTKENDSLSIVHLNMPKESQEKIDSIISSAVQEEIIRDDFKKYVDANWMYQGDTIPVEVRLKGDWTDHLISGSVSYRVKTADDFAFKGLTSFSIQHPKTRNYMHEWFMHAWFEKEGLLSTRYDFLQVNVNDSYEGVYALEEHFDKQLLESRNRREGPILKLDESGFWALAILARLKGESKLIAPFYQASIPTCFKENRTLKSAALSAQFFNGSRLLEHFKMGYEHPDLIFDIKQLATYYALMDMGNIHHAMAWHNRRFYYNPVTTKLEHIGFDMAPMIRPLNPLMVNELFKTEIDSLAPESCLNYRIFQNASFRKYYIEKLTEFSSPEFLDQLFSNLDSAIQFNENLLGLEQEGFKFDRAIYYEKAALVRNELKTIDQNWDAFLLASASIDPPVNGVKNEYELGNSSFYLKEISINAYRTKFDSADYRIQVENYHFATVTLLGYTIKGEKDSLIRFEEPIVLQGFKGGELADSISIRLNQKPSRILFEVANRPGIIKSKKFIKWGKFKDEHPRIKLMNGFSENTAYYSVQGNELRFKSGAYVLDKLLYIPEGYRVLFEAGTTIDFIKNGGLILNDHTEMRGTVDSPVRFVSSDSTGMGITILQADSVLVNHVVVENMGTLNYGGWVLTGAFTIYESEVLIDGLTIRGNTCEDGLNLIRSHFSIKNCLIENTKSDGFDADFCTGEFSYSTFKNTGNDCIDFSGSRVMISDIEIKNSGDKGVSAGERSNLTLMRINIDGALTGLASKDGSTLVGSSITVKNAEVGLAAFQKKPEYGFSSMTLSNVLCESLNRPGLIEKGSYVIVDGTTYYGYQKFDIEKMYARFGEK